MPRWLHAPAAGLASGLLLALSFPDAGLFPLAWVALTPYLLFLLRKPSWKATLLGHVGLSLGYFGVALYWIPRVLNIYGKLGGWVAALIFAVMLAALAVQIAPFTLVTRWLAGHDQRMALITAPAGWLVSEIFRNYLIADGFPWAALGYSQYPYRCVIQVVDLIGVYGLGWLVAMGSCALAGWLAWRWRTPALVFGGLLLLCNLYGLYRLYLWEPPPGRTLRVALVQPNIAVSGSRSYYSSAFFQRLPDLYEQAAGGSDLVIFPEAPNPFYFLEDFYFSTFYRRLVRDYGTPLIFNGTTRREGSSYNSAFLLDSTGAVASRYDKIHLVPFGEYLPYGTILGFSRPLVTHIGGFAAAPAREELVRLDDTPVGLLICYEAIFPELSRQAVQNGAQLLVNLTNDLWFGDTAAPEQHFEMAAFRALEQRKFLLRAANSGYSGVVDPWGRILQRSPLFQTEVFATEVTANAYQSWYAASGESACFLIIIATVAAAFRVVRGALRRGPPPGLETASAE